MSSAVAIRASSPEVVDGATDVALVLPDGMTENEWASVGATLGRAHRASGWWIGDWINYGEAAGYVSRDRYTLAEQITGMARKTLRNYAAIARAFDSSLRRDELTVTHHATVIALPSDERSAVLNEAATQEWSIERLREETRTKPSQQRVFPNRRHESVIATARSFVKVVEPWNADMAVALSPPEARKQLTVLHKAAERLAEVIAAVEYRAATPHQFMGR